MRKYFIPLVATLLAIASPGARAGISVVASAGPGQPAFYLPDLGAVPDGTWYCIGTFSQASDLSMASSAPASLFTSSWETFAVSQTLSIFNQPGRAAGNFNGGEQFSGQQIYWWVTKTEDGLAPTIDFSNVASHALFTGGSPGAWTFAAPGEPAPVIATSDQLVMHAGSLHENNIMLSNISSSPVPEPSALVLLALGGLGALRRRR